MRKEAEAYYGLVACKVLEFWCSMPEYDAFEVAKLYAKDSLTRERCKFLIKVYIKHRNSKKSQVKRRIEAAKIAVGCLARELCFYELSVVSMVLPRESDFSTCNSISELKSLFRMKMDMFWLLGEQYFRFPDSFFRIRQSVDDAKKVFCELRDNIYQVKDLLEKQYDSLLEGDYLEDIKVEILQVKARHLARINSRKVAINMIEVIRAQAGVMKHTDGNVLASIPEDRAI